MMSAVQLCFVALSCCLWLKSHFTLVSLTRETFPWTQHNPQLLGMSLRNVKVEQRLSQLLINHLVILLYIIPSSWLETFEDLVGWWYPMNAGVICDIFKWRSSGQMCIRHSCSPKKCLPACFICFKNFVWSVFLRNIKYKLFLSCIMFWLRWTTDHNHHGNMSNKVINIEPFNIITSSVI